MLRNQIDELRRMCRSLASPLRRQFYATLLMNLELEMMQHELELAKRDDRIRELEKQIAAA